MNGKIDLPDFDAMLELAEKIGREKTELLICKNELDYMLGEISQRATSEQTFWTDGKPPSNAHIKSTFFALGLDEANGLELKRLRTRIAELEGYLRTDEALFSVYQDMIGVWRTQSANERGTFLE